MQSVLKKEMVINNSRQLILSDASFKAGEKVLVFITTENALQTKLAKWKTLFKQTQALPQLQDITEADIAAEIEAYRVGL